jgi:HlyD family secretion protein
VTTRLLKEAHKKPAGLTGSDSAKTNATSGATNSVTATNTPSAAKSDKKGKDTVKPIEVVFVVEGDHVKMRPVKIGISDETHWEITEGLKEGEEVVSGGYRAISRELEDGKKIRKGTPKKEEGEEKK